MTGDLAITSKYFLLGTGHISGNIEFHYYSFMFVLGIIVGKMMNMMGSVCNG